MGVLGKRKALRTVEKLATKLAFWHGQRISHEGRTVAYWNGGEFIAFFCAGHSCQPDSVVTRIEFERIPT